MGPVSGIIGFRVFEKGAPLRFTVEEIPLGDRRLRAFGEVPWRLHRGDPFWTPPLRGELLGSRLLGLTGLLSPNHPYHRHAEVTHFLARAGKRPLGRVAAAINYRFNEHHKTNTGFFGFFEAIDDFRVAKELLDRAREWLLARGMEAMRGPGGYSTATHEPHQGVLISGFDTPPTVELTHNPPYYTELLERYGLRKAKDYYAYIIPTEGVPNDGGLSALAARVRARRGIETRPVEMDRLRAEVGLIVEVYNQAWAANWGFLPLTEKEADAMAETLALVSDPELVRFAYLRGELAGVIGAIPDPNVALRPRWRPVLDTDIARALRLFITRRRIRRLRVMFFGIRPQFRKLGVDVVLYHEVTELARARGYREGEASMLLEDNHLILRASAAMGGRRYKTWRIYEMPLV
ncbi:MAG: Uncharacterized protein XD60_0841 [Acetothermia bacterium 64_32]|nr:MAG: Uncharacterized protein XD60_0841 [Acetothermia bacterium 64_32]